MTSVKEQLSNVFQEPGSGAGLGMRLSVWCAEEYPFNSQEIIQAEPQNTPRSRDCHLLYSKMKYVKYGVLKSIGP